MADRKTLGEEIEIILKTPKTYLITVIILGILFYFLFDKIIYNTILNLKQAQIESLKQDNSKLERENSSLQSFIHEKVGTSKVRSTR